MNKTFFTSDLHFGHKNIIQYDSRPFKDTEEMDRKLIERWNRKVDATDSIYILGDVSWYGSQKTTDILNQLNGKKHLIKGNHDDIRGNIKDCYEAVKEYVEINVDGKKVILSHYPIHFYNHHYFGAIMLYGHVHNSHEEDWVQKFRKDLNSDNIPCEMYNVGTMLWNYEPVTLEEMLKGDV